MFNSKILIVDDERDISDLIEMALKSNGFTNIKKVFNGTDALKSIDEWSPTLILLDLMLPEVDGLTICKKTKSNLRKCTQGDNVKNTSINKSNTSGVTGIHWNKKISKWQAYIRVNRKQIHLGYFTSKTEAIRVRVHSELEIFGEYAPTYNYFTEDQRKAILDDTMPAEEIVEILKLNRDVEQCV